MKRRGGKREGAGWKKSPALTKITREINEKHWRANHHYIYIFGKSHFITLAKGSCGGNVRKLFELRVMAAWFAAQTKTSFGTQSIISSTRTTSSGTLFSTGRTSALAMTWVCFLNLDSREIIKAKYLIESRNERLNNSSTSEVFIDVWLSLDKSISKFSMVSRK